MTDSNKQENESVSLKKGDLQDLITSAVTAAVAAMKAPSAAEQAEAEAKRAQIEIDQANRKKTAQSVLEEIDYKKQIQRICSHEHRNGDTHCVYVQEKTGPGYLLCQKNQCLIRPGEKPKDYRGMAIFNTDLFNKVFQKLTTQGEIFG